ncbi:actin-like ATPase domain-containing protein [Morchella conica CCBAS932]|uniref:Actin-like ATPase domain-containing protein n=1 Tax=Morchella conica CCBAS932 TaxID=1392247 RepID=A0A3N4KRB8_9PEZI|nr:actin-like ATPase domain-containing protein [Morchella conica CCBAS932]
MIQPPTDAFANLGISAPVPLVCSSGSSVASSTTLGLVGDIPTAITTVTAADRLVVGVDFGTTYSGVAAVYSGTPDDIEVIKTWPGGNGITSDKVPTEISYTPSTGNASSYRWGFQPTPTSPRLRCLKLFLDRNQKIPNYVSPLETATLLRGVNKSVLDAISDYLGALHAHTITTLTRRYGISFMAITPITWVLTVPAVWSDAAKTATRHAAERAGMKSPRLISEPEAAAVYTLKAIQPNTLSVGDHFVVCDAGGGTADLISYEIVALEPDLKLAESSIGTGGLCGSVLLNYAFEEHCRKRLGRGVYNGLKPKTRAMAMKYWDEYVKRNFKYINSATSDGSEDGEDEEEISVPFPGLPDDEEKRVESGFLMLKKDELRDIFEPVVEQVVDLCEDQVETIRRKGGKVKGIVLVGGFGQSNYLYNRLDSHFNSPPPYGETPISIAPLPKVEIMQPLYAWTAVVRGAVLRGLEGSIIASRKARYHYGTSYATVWEEGKHPKAERYWSPLWERWMIDDRMEWHINRGQSISENTPIRFHYTRNFESSLIVEEELMICESAIAPMTRKDQSVRPLCTLKTDLSTVPKKEFTRLETSDGRVFMNLDFALELRVDSASLMFELKVKGISYGSVTATFH